MPNLDADRPYTLRDVMNMLLERLPNERDTSWLRDPEGNPNVQAYGSRSHPSQPVYVNYRPSVVKMQIRFTPRRISPSREEELWQATDAARPTLRSAGLTSRRQMGNTQETERDEQWVLTLPERLSEAGYDVLGEFVALAANCMGVERPEE